MNYTTLAQALLCAVALSSLPLAADDAQLLDQFRKTRPDISEVHVIQEQPLLVAVTGQNASARTHASWDKGELLGVFGRRGDQIVPISVQPNEEFRKAVWVERQGPDSISLAQADDYGARVENIKIFYDAKTYFPKRIVRFSPVHVRHITMTAGVLTITGSDDKQDFTARERKDAWRITSAPAVPAPPPPTLTTLGQVTPMPVSTLGQFEQARPEKAKLSAAAGAADISEEIGPYQRVGTRIWISETLFDSEGDVGVGDIGYFDQTAQDWTFLHLPEMADWAASALLVEPDAVWVGLVSRREGASDSGGLLHYDRTTHKVTKTEVPDVIDKIIRVGRQIYCGTSGGFAVVEQGSVRRFEFAPQLDGTYVITPVI